MKERQQADAARSEQILRAMRAAPVLVLGDMVADIYVTGEISRISREAPVLVLRQADERIVAGGAANVANNVATLGGRALAAGLVGCDGAGEGLVRILAENGADVSGLCRDEARPTVTKTRIIAGGRATVSQQIVRIDKESEAPLSPAAGLELLRAVDRLLPRAAGVVLSDYGAGAVTARLVEEVVGYCRAKGVPTIADSRYEIGRFRGISYVKQNDAELAAALGRHLADTPALVAGAQALCSTLEAKGVLVTRGEKGMTLCLADGRVEHIPVADKSEVFDVSGAGDTCVATMILALAGGAAPVEAARMSNVASGIAVRKRGTATVSAGELAAALRCSGHAILA